MSLAINHSQHDNSSSIEETRAVTLGESESLCKIIYSYPAA